MTHKCDIKLSFYATTKINTLEIKFDRRPIYSNKYTLRNLIKFDKKFK